MKKILSLCLTAVIVLTSLALVSVSAEEETNWRDKGWVFSEKYFETFIDGGYEGPDRIMNSYKEIHCEYDENGNVLWVITYCREPAPPWLVAQYEVLDKIVIIDSPAGANVYRIYNVAENKWHYGFKILSEDGQYKNVPQILYEAGVGDVIGDMDKDREITVKDATFIQKALSDILYFPEKDKVHGYSERGVVSDTYPRNGGEVLAYVSDFNRDGNRDIKDATAIQKSAANVK